MVLFFDNSCFMSYFQFTAEQQAAAVAELMQVSAQRDAHRAMLAADR